MHWTVIVLTCLMRRLRNGALLIHCVYAYAADMNVVVIQAAPVKSATFVPCALTI